MFKTSKSTESKTRPGEGGVRDGGNNRAKRDRSRSRIDDGEVNGNEFEDNEIGKKVQKSSKSKNLSKSKKIVRSDFFIPGAKLLFTKLRQAFVKAPILHYFDLERHIRIETDASGYAIDENVCQLTLDDSSRWHPAAFFSQKMILAETRYKTHDNELLAIVEAFKTWKHYL